MKIRNKRTGQIFEVIAGTLYPSFFEEVKDEEIKVGEPTVEYVIEEHKEEVAVKKPAAKKSKKTKKSKRGAKKNESSTE